MMLEGDWFLPSGKNLPRRPGATFQMILAIIQNWGSVYCGVYLVKLAAPLPN